MDSTAPESTRTAGKYGHFVSCFLPQVPFALLAIGAYYGGYWLLLPAVFLLVVLPLLDTLTGWQDNLQFEKSDFSAFEIFLLRWNTRLYAIFYLAAVIFFAKFAGRLTGAE